MNAWTAASLLTRIPTTVPQTVTFTRVESTNVRDAVRGARFHFVLPQGLPKGWSLRNALHGGHGPFVLGRASHERRYAGDVRADEVGAALQIRPMGGAL